MDKSKKVKHDVESMTACMLKAKKLGELPALLKLVNHSFAKIHQKIDKFDDRDGI